MNNTVLVSPNGTRYILTVTDSGVLGTIKINDTDTYITNNKLNIIAVIFDSKLNRDQVLFCKNLVEKGNKLVYIKTSVDNLSFSEIEIAQNQYYNFIKISNEILFINSDIISDNSVKYIKYALEANKPIKLYNVMTEEEFIKLL